MAATTSVVSTPSRQRHPWLAVALASLVAGWLFHGTGYGNVILSYSYPTFQGACSRILDLGMRVLPSDRFFCPTFDMAPVRLLTSIGGMAAAIGVVLPGVILAATGRRVTALIPLFIVIWKASTFFSQPDWGQTTFIHHPLEGEVLLLAILALPALAGMVVTPRKSAGSGARMLPLAASALVCAVLGLVVWRVFPANLSLFRELSVFNWLPVWSAFMIGAFGALLGPDRRWWPWSLAPIAFLLTGAVPLAFAVGPGEPSRTVVWGMLGLVPLLVGIGLLGSAWKPLAGVFCRSRTFSRITALLPARWRTTRVSISTDPLRPTRATKRLRPTAVLNALALALVILSTAAFQNDPWILRFATPISSSDILLRTMAQDVRTRRNLREALGVMDTYRDDYGSYSGFRVAAGRAALPSIRWHAGPAITRTPSLTVAVLGMGDQRVRLAAMSSSGSAFCLEENAAGIRYGKSSDGLHGADAVHSAVAACGSEVWTPQALIPPPAIHCPAYVNAYLLCRMIAVIRENTLRSPKGV